MKIHILGGPGSGKSYIARRLGERYGIPFLDLDGIFWDPNTMGFSSKADPEARDVALIEFIAQDSWIVEGAYYRWLAPSFQAADWIFVLTPPLWVRQVRIIRRFILRKIGLERGKKESFRSLMNLMDWGRNYDGDNLLRATKILKDLGRSPILCTGLEEVTDHLEQQI
ncbi:MAG: DNA topology modulation protein FlaR [Kiritimatiellae bacterium]|jgi:adenylate kinase family enzyme|nr:DNA topology modulation protein FlaR [Kiritimatiellia bacterium]